MPEVLSHFLGIAEDRNHNPLVTGVEDPDALLRDLWNGLSNPQKVSANLLLDSDVYVAWCGDRQVLVIRVPRAERSLKPVFLNENPLRGTFRRSGDGDRHCTVEEVRAMERDSGDGAIDKLSLPEFGLDVFCDDTVRAYRRVFDTARRNHPWSKLDNEEFLLKIGALGRSVDDGQMHPTRAGLLMFGYAWRITDEYPAYFLDCRQATAGRRWDNRITSSSGEWSGNVFDFSMRAYTMMSEGLPVPFELDSTMRRIDDTPQHKAVREALTNALVHTDYYGRTGIVCVRTPDMLEISNPGSLRLPAEVIEAGGVSDPRNLTMLTMFNLIGMGERAGSGFDMFRRAAEYAKVEGPDFQEFFAPDRVVLRLHLEPRGLGFAQGQAGGTSGFADDERIQADSTSGFADDERIQADSTSGFADDERIQCETHSSDRDKRVEEIFRLLKERGSVSTPEVAEVLGLSQPRTRKILSDLVVDGRLASTGAARLTRYVLPDEEFGTKGTTA